MKRWFALVLPLLMTQVSQAACIQRDGFPVPYPLSVQILSLNEKSWLFTSRNEISLRYSRVYGGRYGYILLNRVEETRTRGVLKPDDNRLCDLSIPTPFCIYVDHESLKIVLESDKTCLQSTLSAVNFYKQ